MQNVMADMGVQDYDTKRTSKAKQLEARLQKAKEERDKCDEVIRNIQSQINTLNQVKDI